MSEGSLHFRTRRGLQKYLSGQVGYLHQLCYTGAAFMWSPPCYQMCSCNVEE